MLGIGAEPEYSDISLFARYFNLNSVFQCLFVYETIKVQKVYICLMSVHIKGLRVEG